jgi:hypothetical protein
LRTNGVPVVGRTRGQHSQCCVPCAHHLSVHHIGFLAGFFATIPASTLAPSHLAGLPLQAKRVEKRLADKKMRMELADSAVEYLATRGYDPAFGARPVKRVVQQELETALAKGILRGEFAVRRVHVHRTRAGAGMVVWAVAGGGPTSRFCLLQQIWIVPCLIAD